MRPFSLDASTLAAVEVAYGSVTNQEYPRLNLCTKLAAGPISATLFKGKIAVKTLLLTITLALTAVACAKTPSSIPPVAVSSSEYSEKSCKGLNAEYTIVSKKLEEAEKKQRGKVAGDAIVVFLILIPPSSMTGDYAADVGRYKGEKIALERAMDKKGCR